MARTKGASARTAETEEQAHEMESRLEVGKAGRTAGAKSPARRPKRVERKTVIDDAVRLVYERLRTEEAPSKETVANLVQLLKMHKEIAEDDGTARGEARYTWPGLEDGKSNG